MKKRSEEWIGFRQGKLEIIAFEGIKRFGVGRSAYFTFKCDCGNKFSAQKSNVIRKRNDCGCSRPAKWSQPDGASKHPLHKTWWAMIDRCTNERNKSYPDYGGRGISVCIRWVWGEGGKTGFELFVDDMGPRPKGHTIERVQTDANYGPGNCMWLPKGDQSKNRRNVRLVRIGNRVQTIPDWCRETGIDYWTAIRRVSRGWPPDKAVTYPIKRRVA